MSKKDGKPKDGKKTKKAGAEHDGGRAFVARVYVALKPTVNDPEGLTIANALGSLGFGGVEGVRSGKFFQVRLRAADAKAAAEQVEQMCSRLLANPVIEMYEFELEKAT
ncbi:phosphoribosylformylglycinamidine synthase subunit PurS [Tepidiforma sp.]|uniref:phosphoribosylformylglycinamidine synthase subunit PurS n=1 Tax=Tepidiforma sp. TaxID=2682230 RepID=UPI002ADDFD7A|nr:phosphoribosylformylglycinamidine synthase subunit PurS [Tepidiforma sp.]